MERQQALREAELATRKAVAAFVRWASQRTGVRAACKLIGLSPRTARNWRKKRRCVVPCGRTPRRANAAARGLARSLCEDLGPCISVPSLQRALPGVAKRELASIASRYRTEHLKKGVVQYVVRWHKPGRVWAMDFTDATVEEPYVGILAVRDLASGRQLAALPVGDYSEETARGALDALVREHGAPLVLKSDNGSAFIAGCMRAFLAAADVHLLLSPVRCPEYNGACEAGIGGLKTRTHHGAARQARAGRWSCDDVEAARLLGNCAPSGPGGLSADDRWSRRTPIEGDERDLFADALARRRKTYPDETERTIIRFAMEDVGAVSFRRRRINLPINPGFRANNS